MAALVALTAALLGVQQFLLRRLHLIIDAVRRLESGDLQARTGMSGRHKDIGRIGAALDRMAAAIEPALAKLMGDRDHTR